ncbi:MAG: cytochrome c oxidase subunit IV [Chlamydiales bacterium]|jgi:cytochrome c oxidase subunit IV
MSEQHHFNANKIFVTLIILTALEVAWGSLLPYDAKLLLWTGLLGFAFWKGALIFMYFMHMKFEGWIVKCLIAPTPILMCVVVFAIMPDVAMNKQLIHELGDQLDPVDGQVVEIGQGSRNIEHSADHDDEDQGGSGH